MKNREFHIDGLKILASQLIVLHHFATYGPLADAFGGATPRLSDWFYDYARMAVQVFLVLGGFLAARSLAPQGNATLTQPVRLVWQRYLRLVPAFAVALLFTIASSQLARIWLPADFIPGTPTWREFLAHVTLLNGVLNVDSLSAGVWYVAIDFQLYALMAMMLWLGRGWAKAGIVGLMLLSLFYFNRNASFDNWAIYFFGAYGLGAIAYWAARSSRAGRWLLLFGAVCIAALVVDFRERIVLALATALLLGLIQWHTLRGRDLAGELPRSWAKWFRYLSNSSYALFLVHFSVLMLGNAGFSHLNSTSAISAGLVLLTCWLVSMSLAMLFVRWVERPLARLGSNGK
ncbi:acyltransferase [Rhodoferax sp. PAMC 29310]|uniref:acyltransferase family protein n=1 Tax=Rhodoferax sp. PAMC 29310 TaxID=2822760 RepID=UPI001B337404|nr:acyltransferase [Rhodoferax sp. PAMC 29310]